jgi:hypothetical protein
MSLKRKPWTAADLKALKEQAKKKMEARTIAKHLKRTAGAVRQKAHEMGVSLDSR